MRGKEDPYLKLGETNDRSRPGNSEYVWSLKDISFDVNQGEVLGIIGKNGAGKSTLLKILSQVTSPTTGQVKVRGRIASLLEVGTGFHPELSGRENIFLNGAILGMSKKEIKTKLDEIIEFSGVARYIDTPVKRYSSGMMVRLGFAVAAHLEPEILIVDEVLAVGDMEFQEKCLGKMKDVSSKGRTVLFVSHNMGAIKQLCTRALLLEHGTLKLSSTTTDVVGSYYASEDAQLEYGKIPRNYARSYNNGQAHFDLVCPVDAKGNYTSTYFFKQPLRIKVELETHVDLKDLLCSIIVLNDEMQKVAYLQYPESSAETMQFRKGMWEMRFDFMDGFLPGKYFISAALYYPNGQAIDQIDRVGEFTVSPDSVDGSHNYLWSEKYGNTYLNLKEILIKEIAHGNKR